MFELIYLKFITMNMKLLSGLSFYSLLYSCESLKEYSIYAFGSMHHFNVNSLQATILLIYIIVTSCCMKPSDQIESVFDPKENSSTEREPLLGNGLISRSRSYMVEWHSDTEVKMKELMSKVSTARCQSQPSEFTTA